MFSSSDFYKNTGNPNIWSQSHDASSKQENPATPPLNQKGAKKPNEVALPILLKGESNAERLANKLSTANNVGEKGLEITSSKGLMASNGEFKAEQSSGIIDNLSPYEELIDSRQSGLASFLADSGVRIPVKVLFADEEVEGLSDVERDNLTTQRKNENNAVRDALKEFKISDHTPIIRIDRKNKTADISYNILWKCKFDGSSTPNNGFLLNEPDIGTAVGRQKQGVGIAQTISTKLQAKGYLTRSIRFQELNRPRDFLEHDLSKDEAWKNYIAHINDIEDLYRKEYNIFIGHLPTNELKPTEIKEDLWECEVLTFIPNTIAAKALTLPKGCVRLQLANCQIVKIATEFFVNIHLRDDKFNGKKEIGKRDDDTVEDFRKIVEMAVHEVGQSNARITITGDFNKVEGEEAAGLDAISSDKLESIKRNEISSLVSKLKASQLGKASLQDLFTVSFNPVPGSYYNGYLSQGQSPDWYVKIEPKRAFTNTNHAEETKNDKR